jgi:hypothetical protein
MHSQIGSCPHCDKTFAARGLVQHIKSCKRKLCKDCQMKADMWFIVCPFKKEM